MLILIFQSRMKISLTCFQCWKFVLTQQLKCNQAKRPTCASALAGKETWTLSTGNPSTWKKIPTYRRNVNKTRASKQWKYRIFSLVIILGGCPCESFFCKLAFQAAYFNNLLFLTNILKIMITIFSTGCYTSFYLLLKSC